MFTEADLEKYLIDLKKILSIETPTYAKRNIKKIINWFIKKSKEFNLHVKFHKHNYHKKSGNTLVITNVDDILNEKFDILIMAHLDTVYKKGTFKKIGFNITDNILKSPGCIDDKGPALMGLYALKYIDFSKIKIAYFLNNNEEVGTPGNNLLIKQLSDNARYCINLEAARPDGSLVDRRYGIQNYKIEFFNNSTKDNEIFSSNLLFEIAGLINTLRSFNSAYNQSYVKFSFVSNSDTNTNQFMQINIQIRFTDIKTNTKFFEVLTRYKQNIRNKDISMNIIQGDYHKGLYLTDSNIQFKKLVEQAGRINKTKITWVSSFGGADSTFVDNLECATLDGLGPIGGNFHTTNEYVEVNSILNRANLLINIISLIIKENKGN